MTPLERQDPAVFHAIQGERRRQQHGLEMIASENYTSPAVMECQGSVLTNKYAEGYPGKRYYGGCEFVDEIEKLAIERVLKIFGAERANVQPHSGAQANMSVFLAALSPGDTILSMDLAHGGHLTHGMRLNFSGKYFNIVHYGVAQSDERVNFDQVAELARKHFPKLIIAGASAYPRILDFDKFAEIARETGALLMVDMAHIAGLVAVNLHPSPVAHADFVTSTTHKTLRGPRAGFVLCKNDWGQKINSAVFPGVQGGPLMHVVAAKAVAFGEVMQPAFAKYMKQTLVNAATIGEGMKAAGFRVVSGGTDNHLLLIDVMSKGVTGKVAEKALDAAGMTVNKNMIPFDTRAPLDPSGIRVGTPALTTRGMKQAEMKRIVGWMAQVLSAADDAALQAKVRGEVDELCQQFPAPTEA